MAPPSETVGAWLSRLPLDPRVAAEMAHFRDGGRGPLSQGYRDAAAGRLRERVTRRVVAGVAAIHEEGCAEGVSVEYPGSGFLETSDPDAKLQERFEDSFVVSEMTACYLLEDPDLPGLLATYTSPEFRMEAQDRIERIWPEDGLSCVHTGGVAMLLDPTTACNQLTTLEAAAIVSEHSQVVAGGGGDGLQTVYFKESVKTFVPIPGGMALHYVNYTRSVTLSGLKKRLGRGRIAESATGQAELLREKLAQGGS